jgi:hypothetical protein
MDELVAKIKLLEDEIKAAVEILTLDDGTNGEFGDVFAEMRSLVQNNVQELQELKRQKQDAKLAHTTVEPVVAQSEPPARRRPFHLLDAIEEQMDFERVALAARLACQ